MATLNIDVTVHGVKFDVEAEYDCYEHSIESMSVVIPGTEVELTEVLDEKVLREIEECIHRNIPEPDYPEPDEIDFPC